MSSVVYSPESVSGFPEWLPEVRLVEQEVGLKLASIQDD